MHFVRALTAIILNECSVIFSAENLRERVLKTNTFFHINCHIQIILFYIQLTLSDFRHLLIIISIKLVSSTHFIIDYFYLHLTSWSHFPQLEKMLSIKTESIRKLSNFNFQWTKTLYQNVWNNITFVFTFFKGY